MANSFHAHHFQPRIDRFYYKSTPAYLENGISHNVQF